MIDVGIVERIGKIIALVAAIIAAGISANTLLSNRVKDRQLQYTAFRNAVTAEEGYYRTLYEDSMQLFSKKLDTEPELKFARHRGLIAFANRDVPTFREFDVDRAEKRWAWIRLRRMQAAVQNTLSEVKVANDEQKAQVAQLLFNGKVTNIDPAPQDTATRQNPVTPGIEPGPKGEKPSLVLAPTSSTGWDVDVFWCLGPTATNNYQTALRLGSDLARLANTGRAIAPGVILGRVRVRSVTLDYNARTAKPELGWRIVADGGLGEREAATALKNSLDAAVSEQKQSFTVANAGGRTRWYLSVFICPVPAPRAP